jgi:hypothetical protein
MIRIISGNKIKILNNMAKQTKTPPKKYIVINPDTRYPVVAMGTMEEVQIELENEWIDKMDNDWDTDEWLNGLEVYELKSPSKLKYTRAKLEIK